MVSVDERNQAAEYLQQYTIDYQLLLPEREPIKQTLTFNRSFFNQTSLALGASRESELLNYEMERQAALRIFLEAQSAGSLMRLYLPQLSAHLAAQPAACYLIFGDASFLCQEVRSGFECGYTCRYRYPTFAY